MLTAKVGESIINCIDGKYDRYILKKWSNKGIIKCPVCNGDYEYCHGDVVSPYFRHIAKECEGYYHEPETDEHRQGKALLYDWINKEEGIKNCHLEYWIPETKQRPDIYFEYNNQRYVIEFQCTPIATEFLRRRELYKLNKINDIWILGLDKYNFDSITENTANRSGRRKSIESELSCDYKNDLMYFDVRRNNFIVESSFVRNSLNISNISYSDHVIHKNNLNFIDGKITLQLVDNHYIYKYNNQNLQEAIRKHNEKLEKENFLRRIEEIVSNINVILNRLDNDYALEITNKYSDRYICSLYLYGSDGINLFIKNESIDVCEEYQYTYRSISYRNRVSFNKGTGYKQIDQIAINKENLLEIEKVLLKKVIEILEPKETLKVKIKAKLEDVLDETIKIIDSDYLINKNVKFRYLRDHDFSSPNYLINTFKQEVLKLKGKEMVFLLRGSSSDYCIRKLNKYGFKNVSKLTDCIKR